jgi:hypothetical protein
MAPDVSQTPTGVEQTGVIDLFGVDEKTGEVLLAMFERRPWSGDELQLFQLQEKLNAYMSFLLDGEMTEAHPELAGRRARIELRCAQMPNEKAIELLSAVHDQIALQDVRLEVVVEEAGCGSGCSCHED